MTSINTCDPDCQGLDVGVRRRGVLILAGFAIIWAMAGSTGVSDPTSGRALFAAAVALAVVAAVPALRSRWLPAASRQRRLAEDWQRRYARVGVAEAAGIGVAVAICLGAGAPNATPDAICLVVGVHFLPLAPIFDQPQYRLTAVGLVAVAAAGLVAITTADAATAIAIVGFGAAAVLCATALHVAMRG
ncbi:MAG: hypothetical protein DLM57_10085 [Pseudonocardiales bacterium]|nr:MAG: hypothetical protein DLM57_10085 [Pseudonocardiales bacterium]